MKTALFSFLLFLLLLCSSARAVDKTCDFCHKGDPGKGNLLNSDINELCSGCHQERLAAGEHKVGVKSPAKANGLPLADGKMTCITCHDPHSQAPSMLRRSGEEVCISCHNK